MFLSVRIPLMVDNNNNIKSRLLEVTFYIDVSYKTNCVLTCKINEYEKIKQWLHLHSLITEILNVYVYVNTCSCA